MRSDTCPWDGRERSRVAGRDISLVAGRDRFRVDALEKFLDEEPPLLRIEL
jgi:hypothetical protein